MDRDPDREVRHLAWRVRIFGAGAIVALVGIYFEAEWLVSVAIGILLLGFVLRFLPTSGEGEGSGEQDAAETSGEPDTG